MKKAIILHGTDGSPEINWFPWLSKELSLRGYQVWCPLLPDNHTPNRATYNDFLFDAGWDFTNNLVVGHSSGAVSVLNLLMDPRCPKIAQAILVGAWAGGLPNGYDTDTKQFDKLFPTDGFDFELIKHKVNKLDFVHGDDDPYCPLEQAVYLSTQLGASLTVINEGHHLGSKFSELPKLLELLET